VQLSQEPHVGGSLGCLKAAEAACQLPLYLGVVRCADSGVRQPEKDAQRFYFGVELRECWRGSMGHHPHP